MTVPRNKLAKIATVVTGSLTLLSSVFGLYLSYKSLAKAIRGEFTELIQEYQIINFYHWFYPMLGVSFLCSLILLWSGFDQVSMRLTRIKIFISVFVFELAYLAFIGIVLWRTPGIAISVGAATGAANQGLWPPFYIFLPVWAPFLLLWARNTLAKENGYNSQDHRRAQ